MAENKPLVEDALIASLVPDPADIPDVRVHVGLLGKSQKRGYWRIYTSPQLNEYIEVREEDIVHCVQMDASHTALRGTVAWIRAEARLARTRTGARQAQTDFLKGDIARSHLRGTRGGGLGWGDWTPILTTLTCAVVVSTVCTVTCETSGENSEISCCYCYPD